jgi:hypothetical protein
VAHGSDSGFVTTTTVVAVALSLVLFTAVANLIVFGYARAAVRAALDEGARQGVRAADPASACEVAVRDALVGLLGGALGDGVRARCAAAPEQVRAEADVTFAGWLPLVPDWRFTAVATALREPAG